MNPSTGYCEGHCGGLYFHDLVGGLCPACRNDPNIRDVSHVAAKPQEEQHREQI